jgi:hypothetical protein
MLIWTLFLVLVCGTDAQSFVCTFQLHSMQPEMKNVDMMIILLTSNFLQFKQTSVSKTTLN